MSQKSAKEPCSCSAHQTMLAASRGAWAGQGDASAERPTNNVGCKQSGRRGKGREYASASAATVCQQEGTLVHLDTRFGWMPASWQHAPTAFTRQNQLCLIDIAARCAWLAGSAPKTTCRERKLAKTRQTKQK